MPLRASAEKQMDMPEYLLSCPPVHLLQTVLGLGMEYFHMDRLKFNDSFRLNPVSSVNRTRDGKQKGLPAHFCRNH